MEQAEQPKVKKICKVIGIYVKLLYNGSYVGRENNTAYYSTHTKLNQIHVSVNDYINFEENDMLDDIMGILIEVEDVAVELHDRAGNDFDTSLAVRLDHVVKELEKLYKKQADHQGVEL